MSSDLQPVSALADPDTLSVSRGPHHHAVRFYDDDAYLATVAAEFLVEGLTAGEPILIVATPEHCSAFTCKLRELGIDIPALRLNGQMTLLDARETLAKFMVGAMPDPDRFANVVGGVIRKATRERKGVPVRVYGEMVDLLWQEGRTESAIELERLWNNLAKQHDFALLCAYAMTGFCHATDAEGFRRVCAQHTHVTPTESFVTLPEEARHAEIAQLQQRARALEVEVVQREQVERRLRDALVVLKVREEELHEREADLRDVLENAAEGIHLVARDGTIEWANATELAMLGYGAEEYIGHNIAEFHLDRPVIQGMLDRLTAGDTLRGAEARMRCKDGSIRHVLVNSNVRWKDGHFVHTRCFTRDITELRLAAQDRELALAAERAARVEADRAREDADRALELAERARAAAEHANRAKSEFLAVMSHELRTPLNAIGGYAELMELGIHGPITGQQREVLDRIQRSQRLLLGLINQVLNYARIETGNVSYRFDEIPVEETLRSAEGLVIPQLRAKGLRFETAGPVEDVRVRADGEKLQQVLLNLLTNAVKFTDRGGLVRVETQVDRDVVRVVVCDTGIGIPASKLSAIFDPFVQVDANYTRTRDGVGLGLAISRDLARGMGGDVTVASVEGEGSTFTLTLRRANGDAG